MAYIIGMVDEDELAALNAAGWNDFDPPAEMLASDLEMTGDRLRMFWVDSCAYSIMSGPDWSPVRHTDPDLELDYTVILLRPEYIANEFGKDVFHTFVSANSPADAVWKAREGACTADDAGSPDDYHVLFVCRGRVACLNPESWNDR